jgi:hypothetical protein
MSKASIFAFEGEGSSLEKVKRIEISTQSVGKLL